MKNPDCTLVTADSSLEISDFGFRISDFRRRRAVSIIEVLFSILVTTVGLFGAIAVFPVASSQARRARTNDSVAAAGRWAVHNIDAMGMRRPDRWVAWHNASNRFQTITNINPNALTIGASFCIDSRFLVNINNANNTSAAVFPYNSPLNGFGQINTNNAEPRMSRVAFFGYQPYYSNNALALLNGNKLLAESIFLLDDDLAFARPGLDENIINPASPTNATIPNDRSLPAIQLFDRQISGGNATLIKRQSQGHLSWLATLVPKVDLALGAFSDEYTLSIVVFEDRPLTDNPTNPNSSLDDIGERVATVVPMDDGSTGGEVLLRVPSTAGADRLKLRANDWIMLACNITYNIGGGPLTLNRFQWYRVTHCDPEPVLNSNNNNYELYATLIGPDWSWPLQNKVAGSDRAILMPGILAVHEKTIRLDYGSSY